MTTMEFTFEVRNTGRSVSDKGWETVDLAHIGVWKSAATLLRERDLVCGNDTFTIVTDWKPMVLRHQRHYAAMSRIDRNAKQKKHPFSGVKFPRRASNVAIRVSSKEGTQKIESVTQSSIHDFF